MKTFSRLFPNGCSKKGREQLRTSWFEKYGNPYLDNIKFSNEICLLDFELSAIDMLESCFAYGGIEDFYKPHESWEYCGKGSHYEHYLNRYINLGGLKENFDKAIEAQKKYLQKCQVRHSVFTDFEGVSYNSIVEI